MIKKLQIHNYAIIQDLELTFPSNLTVITGETGAGKSILLGALNLVLGQRADTKSIGDAHEKCFVEAEFTLENSDLIPFFESHDLDFDRELIIRREISPQGKSRAFINDTPVTLDILQTIANALIDVHQQFDTLDIYQVSTQLKMIDALAGNKPLLGEYQSHYKKYQKSILQRDEWKQLLKRQKQEEEFVRFQFNELEEASLSSGELESLEQEQKELAHTSEIKETTGLFAHTVIENENNIINQLKGLAKKVEHILNFHSRLRSVSERIQSVIIELEDIADECNTIQDSVEAKPGRLAEVEERLNRLYRLMQKHRIDEFDQLISLKESLQQKISSSEELENKIEGIEKELKAQIEELTSLSQELSAKRKKVIPGFIENIYALLHPMNMEQTRIQINLATLADFNLTGRDEMEFLLATNKGGSFLPIKNIASGGEIARFNLVTKSLVAQAIPLPTLIFDEIDIGIGGDVALKMGQILKALAKNHQVICITHSPQIASKGDMHYFVFKDDTSDRTLAQVKKLNKADRIQAIAAMLSTNPPSPAAVKNAKELIEIE
ncbi:MAG: DNA repair protein RecN [Saprospiraceae bacterium]